MKIRHKQSGVELEGEFASKDLVFLQLSGNPMALHSMYSKEHWEAVPPPKRYRDVTAGCICDERQIVYGGITAVQVLSGGYRLRKVKLYQHPEDAGYGKPVWAFIIEKEEA